MLGALCVYAQLLRNVMSQGDTGRMVSFSSSIWKKEPKALRELSRLGPNIRPLGELLFLLMKKKPTFVPDSDAFKSCTGQSGASKDEQADSSSENNVGNGALFVIGLHGSGDAPLCLQDWEVAKVAFSYQKALDMLCQDLHDVERRRGWFGFCARLFVEGTE